MDLGWVGALLEALNHGWTDGLRRQIPLGTMIFGYTHCFAFAIYPFLDDTTRDGDG
jgi:hypothetical protein